MVNHPTSGSFSPDRPARVLKFGGTSVGTVERLHDAVHVIEAAAEECRPVVVVSAAAGVTDLLEKAADAAPYPSEAATTWGERVKDRYRTLAERTIADETLRVRYESTLRARLSVLRQHLTETAPERSSARDAVLAVGERLMAPLMAGVLAEADCRAQAVDAASLIRTDARHGAAVVEEADTRTRVRRWWAQWEAGIPVVTGFIGETTDGTTTTLGRGGSDYSAALLAQGLGAERLERWTDVDGLYTSDPAEDDDARRLSSLQMEEARAWAKEGRLGLHPRTLDPLSAAGIPLYVRCTHRPDAPGTRILPDISSHRREPSSGPTR